MLVWALFFLYFKITVEPNNYIITFIIFQIFFIPASLCYIKMARRNVSDIKKVKSILRRGLKINRTYNTCTT